MKRTLSILLLLSAMAFYAGASTTWTIGGTTCTVDTLKHVQIGPGTTYTALKTTGRTLRIFYTVTDISNPNVEIREALANYKVTGLAKTSSIATTYTTDYGVPYFAAVNGDLFSSNRPIGATVQDREPVKADNEQGWYNFAIDTSNQAYTSAMIFWGTAAKVGGSSFTISTVNAACLSNQLALFTPRWDSTTGQSGVTEARMKLVAGALKYGQTATFEVTAKSTAGSMSLSDNYVLSGKGTAATFVNGLAAGDRVTVNLHLEHDGTDITPKTVIGGWPTILKDGVATGITGTTAGASSANPRTAVGFDQSGTKIYMVVVDGRTSISVGLTTNHLADVMKAIGCHGALNLDGGGSSTMYVRNMGGIQNVPSDGSERSVTNALCAVAVNPGGSTIEQIRFLDWKKDLDNGGTYTPVIYGYSSTGVLLSTNVTGFTLSVPTTEAGTISGTTLTAGSDVRFLLTATYNGATATIPVKVGSGSKFVDYQVPTDSNGDAIRGIFAYGLNMTHDESQGSYSFTFGANNPAEETKLVFTDSSTGELLYEKTIANATTSNQQIDGTTTTYNTATVTQAELDNAIPREAFVNWGVKLKGHAIESSGLRLNTSGSKYNNDNGAYGGNNYNICTFQNIRVAVDNSPESDYLGNVYVNNWSGYDSSNDFSWKADGTEPGRDPVMSNGIVRFVQSRQETANGRIYNNWGRARFVSSEHGDTRTAKFTYRGSGIGQGLSYASCVLRENFGIAVGNDGTIYLGEHTDAQWANKANIVILNPAEMNNDHDAKAAYFFYGGETKAESCMVSSTGLWSNSGGSGWHYGGSASGVAVTGSGADTRLCAVMQDFDRYNGTTFIGDIAVYKIGNADGTLRRFWGNDDDSHQPTTMLATGVSASFLSDVADISPLRNLRGDSKGGLWVCTSRPDGTENRDNIDCPILMYFTAAQLAQPRTDYLGPRDAAFNCARDMTIGQYPANGRPGGCLGAGFAVSPDNSILAIVNGAGYILLYDITWNGDTPSLQLRQNTGGKSQRWLCDDLTDDGKILQMDFDWGNNLYAGGKKLAVYSVIDNTANTHTTPAKKSQTIHVNPNTGIDRIDASPTPMAVKFFNLQGFEIDRPNGNEAYIRLTLFSDGSVTASKQICTIQK